MMELTCDCRRERKGLLYPMSVIAIIVAIVFSIVSLASITGSMPTALLSKAVAAAGIPSSGGVAELAPVGVADEMPAGAAFQCAECGVIKSVRELANDGGI